MHLRNHVAMRSPHLTGDSVCKIAANDDVPLSPKLFVECFLCCLRSSADVQLPNRAHEGAFLQMQWAPAHLCRLFQVVFVLFCCCYAQVYRFVPQLCFHVALLHKGVI